jgi:hypothetical protein
MTLSRKLICSLLVLAFLTSVKAFSQTREIGSQEREFVPLYSKLASFIKADYDSLSFYSDKCGKEFTSFIQNNPNTLSYPFRELDSSYCEIRTSSHGSFRIFSWATWTGGTIIFPKQSISGRTKVRCFRKFGKIKKVAQAAFAPRPSQLTSMASPII